MVVSEAAVSAKHHRLKKKRVSSDCVDAHTPVRDDQKITQQKTEQREGGDLAGELRIREFEKAHKGKQQNVPDDQYYIDKQQDHYEAIPRPANSSNQQPYQQSSCRMQPSRRQISARPSGRTYEQNSGHAVNKCSVRDPTKAEEKKASAIISSDPKTRLRMTNFAKVCEKSMEEINLAIQQLNDELKHALIKVDEQASDINAKARENSILEEKLEKKQREITELEQVHESKLRDCQRELEHEQNLREQIQQSEACLGQRLKVQRDEHQQVELELQQELQKVQQQCTQFWEQLLAAVDEKQQLEESVQQQLKEQRDQHQQELQEQRDQHQVLQQELQEVRQQCTQFQQQLFEVVHEKEQLQAHLQEQLREQQDQHHQTEMQLQEVRQQCTQFQQQVREVVLEKEQLQARLQQQLREQQDQHRQVEMQLQQEVREARQQLREAADERQQFQARVETAVAFIQGDPLATQVGFDAI